MLQETLLISIRCIFISVTRQAYNCQLIEGFLCVDIGESAGGGGGGGGEEGEVGVGNEIFGLFHVTPV